ncbi:MAG: PAS domain-containing protein [Alphaproteobacteria bacterium]|nr:PAS domain-containing protein [Alphaproteobacteria bacterium]
MPTPREYAATAARALYELLHLSPTDRDAGRVVGIIETAVRKAMRRGIERGRSIERRKPEEAKSSASVRLTQLLAAAPAVIYSFDARGPFAPSFVSQNIKDLLGYEPAEYLESSDFWRHCVHPDDLAAVEAEFLQLFETGRHTVEYRFLKKNGSYCWVSDEWCLVRDEQGQPVEVVGSWSDITARKALEDQLRQAQKMEAVGQLTGGIAHDFNNLLTGILGNLELLRSRVKDERGQRLLQNAVRSADRGAQLTGQLLAFSRRQHLAPRPTDLNRLVDGMQGMLLSTLGGTIRIETVLRPDLWPALADPTPIELAILNLAINARDAMPTGGTIMVETENAVLRRPPEQPEEPTPGEYVAVSVKDTGAGMEPRVLARVFEPFFTTKEVGKGSGLGLSQVWGVARQLGGGVRIESRLGEGTIVTIYLPRATAAALVTDLERRRCADANLDGTVVLLADDDADARTALTAMLGELGCSVIEAESGAAAVRALADSYRRIDIVLLDFAMPEMNGVEVERRARALRPDVPILFVTGYADDGELGEIADSERILQKPLRIAELAATLARSLPTTPAA